ncbi:DUF1570 domain-containing protein [Crateriforma conspicua]|uniref:DUF1570 domain-containing protein n=1 Tax=Crateriforma conspicua TaxID=2527996 RepID=A0A5C6FWJ5_9PLAN|nr:DUF1570 domain-containing protein [Crateriforma conspicua]TWU65800.1 hypothetical protein V7x_13530 [Crateriforma conspicua]
MPEPTDQPSSSTERVQARRCCGSVSFRRVFQLLMFAALVLVLPAMSLSATPPALIRFNLNGHLQTGLELIRIGKESVVIGRDGALHSLDPRDSNEYLGRAKGEYEPLGGAELANRLRREFGDRFEVVATKHFLVVQPKGRGRKWPDLFEKSHQIFVRYMTQRGVHVRRGRFPMVAVVFPDSRSMYREFARLGLDVSRVAGIYSNNTNRVMTHDSGHIQMIVATVRHEAAHQSGFNSGVHSRVNDTPRWVTEGIGQLFEPAAMGNVRAGSDSRSRINRESLHQLTKTYGRFDNTTFARDLRRLVIDDRLFDGEPSIGNAYAIAWAMMFYLAEREPQQFASILNHTAGRPAFKTYERHERIADFERIVGGSTADFAKKLAAYLRHLQG